MSSHTLWVSHLQYGAIRDVMTGVMCGIPTSTPQEGVWMLTTCCIFVTCCGWQAP